MGVVEAVAHELPDLVEVRRFDPAGAASGWLAVSAFAGHALSAPIAARARISLRVAFIGFIGSG